MPVTRLSAPAALDPAFFEISSEPMLSTICAPDLRSASRAVSVAAMRWRGRRFVDDALILHLPGWLPPALAAKPQGGDEAPVEGRLRLDRGPFDQLPGETAGAFPYHPLGPDDLRFVLGLSRSD